MSLLIGRHIYWTLSNDSEVAEMTEGRIYPVVVQEGVNGVTWITFETQTVEPDYTKDGLVCDNHLVTVNCVAPTYDAAIDLANAVREALDQVTVQYTEEGFEVTDSSLRSADEGYTNQGYNVTLSFDMETESL